MTLGRKPSPKPRQPCGPPLPPEIVTVLRGNAEQILARHVATPDGRCSYCSATWLHTDTPHPCPPVRIAVEFMRLTGYQPPSAPAPSPSGHEQ